LHFRRLLSIGHSVTFYATFLTMAINFTFGANRTNTQQPQPATSTGFSGFGTGTVPSGGLSTGGGFGGTSTTGTGLMTTTSSAPFSFNLGGTGTTTSTPSTGLSFGGLSAAPTSLSFGGLSAPTITAVVTGTTDSIALRGLGGEGASGESTLSSSKNPRDQPLPPELKTIVEEFKNFLKDIKNTRDENMLPKYSIQPIVDISNELDDNLKIQLEKLDVVLRKNQKSLEALKRETSKIFEDGENAVRGLKQDSIVSGTQAPYLSTSLTSQTGRFLPSSSTSAYFSHLVSEFEETMTIYSNQIRELENHLENITKINTINGNDIISIVKRQHEALIALAAEVYALHEQVCRLAEDERAYPRGLSSSGMIHPNISINTAQKLSEKERQVTKPIAFPTFSFDRPATSIPSGSESVSVLQPSPFRGDQLSPSSSGILFASPPKSNPPSQLNMSFGSPQSMSSPQGNNNTSLGGNRSSSFLF